MAKRQQPRVQDPPEPSLTVRNLGHLGVNVVDSPIHLEDGELRQAQNAEPYDELGEGAIRKRRGIDFFTTDGLGAPVTAMTSVPLPDPFPPSDDDLDTTGTRLYWSAQAGGTDLFTTLDGTIWSPATAPPDEVFGANNFGLFTGGGALSKTGQLLYAIRVSGNTLTVYSWNGSSRSTIAAEVTGGGIDPFGIVGLDGDTYVLMGDQRLMTPDGLGGFDTPVTISGNQPMCLVGARHRIYLGCQDQIRYWSATEGTVDDFTLTPAGGSVLVMDIAVFDGGLYAATLVASGAPTTQRVMRRVDDGNWTDITPAAAGNYGPMAVFDDELYVARNASGAFAGCEVLRYNGSTWTTDQDMTAIASGATQVSALRAFNGALYASIYATAYTVGRRSGGTWSSVKTRAVSDPSFAGALGFY